MNGINSRQSRKGKIMSKCVNVKCQEYNSNMPGNCGHISDLTGCYAIENGCVHSEDNKNPFRKRATELEWLKWFFQRADFGPCESDVRNHMRQSFMDETGKNLPDGYNFDSDGETIIDR